MSRKHRRLAAAALPFALVAAAPAVASAATAFYGVTSDNRLVQFQSDNTKTVPSLPIRGLAAGERVVGIDVRPTDTRLYGITNRSRIVIIAPRNAQASYVSASAVDPALTGDRLGFDFNPTVDQIRVVTNAAQNLQVDPATGVLTRQSVQPTPGATPEPGATPAPTTVAGTPGRNLAYVAGDPGAGTAPQVTASAYTNSSPAGSSTELFGLDLARRVLVKQDPPSDGTLRTIGSLNQSGDPIAFDIAERNSAYAAISTRAGGTVVGLYTLNLATGAASPVGSAFTIDTTQPLVGLAAAGDIDDDTSGPRISVASSSTQLRSRLLEGGVQMTVNANEAVSGEARVRYRNRTVGTADVEIRGGAGSDRVAVRLSGSTRDAIRRGSVRLDLRVEVADGAGNRSTLSRPIRTR